MHCRNYSLNFVNHTSRETDSCSASQITAILLRNPKVCYHVHRSPTAVAILNQSSPCHPVLMPHFNIIVPFTPSSSRWLVPSGFPTKTVRICLLWHECYMSCPSRASFQLDNIGESTDYEVPHCVFHSKLLSLRPTSSPCSQTPSVCIFPSMWDTRTQIFTPFNSRTTQHVGFLGNASGFH
jgi:hypothetical protein